MLTSEKINAFILNNFRPEGYEEYRILENSDDVVAVSFAIVVCCYNEKCSQLDGFSCLADFINDSKIAPVIMKEFMVGLPPIFDTSSIYMGPCNDVYYAVIDGPETEEPKMEKSLERNIAYQLLHNARKFL